MKSIYSKEDKPMTEQPISAEIKKWIDEYFKEHFSSRSTYGLWIAGATALYHLLGRLGGLASKGKKKNAHL